MKTILPKGLTVEFTTNWRMSLDSKDITPKALRDFSLFPWKIDSKNPWWNRPLKKGEISCSINHWLCWNHAIETAENMFLILEDDVYFVDEFMAQLEQGLKRLNSYDPKWELLYLGRVPLENDAYVIGGIVRPGYSHCTFAYMLTRSGVKKVLDAEFEKALIPVDEFLPAMYIDHPREDVRRRFPKRLSTYAFEPAIVFQLPKNIAGSDTEESDFITWR